MSVAAEAAEDFLPAVLHIQDVDILLFEIVTVEIAAAIDEDLVARVETIDQIVAPFVVCKDAPGRVASQRSQGAGRINFGIELRTELLGRVRCEDQRGHQQQSEYTHQVKAADGIGLSSLVSQCVEPAG